MNCRKELPSVNEIYGEFRSRGLNVLLISFREDPNVVRRAVRERRYIAPVLLDRSGDVTGRSYGVFGPPTLYVVDGKGQLLGRAVGPRAWGSPAARAFIQSLLERYAKP